MFWWNGRKFQEFGHKPTELIKYLARSWLENPWEESTKVQNRVPVAPQKLDLSSQQLKKKGIW